jgi:hypothetical protein
MTKYRFGLAVALVGLILATFLTVGIATSQNTNKPGQKITVTKQEEATPIELGVMTEKQKKHSKLFKGTHYSRGRKVADLVAKQGDVRLWGPIREASLRPVALSVVLTNLKCNTDAVIIGVVKSKSSNLIETGTFVFTDYEITVEEILKNNDLAPIRQGGEITVPRLGGKVVLRGHVVQAVDEGMAPLAIGERYLFYLKYEPLAETYRPYGHPSYDDTFHLNGDKISQVSDKVLPFEQHQATDATSFINEVRNTLNNPCNTGGGK